ncbi:hypothetical protein ABH056_004883 [Escherichia coli]
MENVNHKNVGNRLSFIEFTSIFRVDKTSEIAVIDKLLILANDLAQAIDADDPDALCAAIAALDVEPYI